MLNSLRFALSERKGRNVMASEPFPRPLIGIMARVQYADGEFKGQQGALLQEYLRIANQDRLFVCVFDPVDVDPKQELLYGYVLTTVDEESDPRIVRAPLSMPLVVYDQVLSRRYESAKRVSRKRQYLRRHAAIFNDGFFNKWQVHEWLSDEDDITAHMLRSAKYTLANLKEFCDKYPVIFIKPIHGSLGRGIIKLTHEEEGWHSMIRLKLARKEQQFSHDCEEVYDHFAERTAKTNHLLQEGVHLLEINNRPLDIRVLMQKNENGDWKGTKTYLRLAAKGEFVSNLSTGGEAFAIRWLKDVMSSSAYQRMRSQVKLLTKKLPDLIEQKSKRTLGEMGLDFGVDKTGQVYILEVNSKPRKNIETTRGSAQLVERALERPLLYALRLYASTERERSAGV